MQTKTFTIRLDMQQALPFHPFEVVEGDTGNVLAITLQNGGEALLLNDCAVVVAFTSSMGFAMQDETSGVTLGAEAGTLTVLLDPNSYGPGIVSADVQVYSGPGNRVLITSMRFDFRCKRSLISEQIIRANAAYPPLIAATQRAAEATEAALAAAARIGRDIGELNVQADWTETDASKDAFILHKPQTPFDLGAPEEIHAYQHAAGGDDPVTPASIGAAVVQARSLTLTPADWTGEHPPYTKEVAASHVTADCHVVAAPAIAHEEAYADCEMKISAQADGQLTFHCETKPLSNVLVNVLTIS